MSDTVTLGLINSFGLLLIAIVTGYFNLRLKNAVVEVGADAAVKAEEVKTTLADVTAETAQKLDGMAQVGKDTHTLVNSNMGVQLKLNAAVTKRLAILTKSKEDIAAAELAASMYEEHLKKQAQVDAGHAVATEAIDDVAKSAMEQTTQRNNARAKHK